jgi:lycopene cyclase domain-containing protein
MFLGIFLVIPILMLLARLTYERGSYNIGKTIASDTKVITLVIGLHIILAVTWTTPWDNYLVATRVWWYDIALVNGATIGYVPVEEYTFFVLQPIMTGLWLIFLMPRLYNSSDSKDYSNKGIRIIATFIVGGIWLISLGLLFSELKQFTYLSLELAWALPPMLIQLAFGADILWKQRKLVLSAIASVTVFLSLADLIAIGMGTWTIDPAQSTGILLANILPIEELIFFLLTNILIVFGTTLALADESKTRAKYLSTAFLRSNAEQNIYLHEV